MFHRLLTPSKSRSFFLFGARGTGKTSLLKKHFTATEALTIDLLESTQEDQYLKNPDLLSHTLAELDKRKKWILIDEVQKVPKLLDVVHKEIEKKRFKFALTGSSARKLKRGSANMLAGRAFVYQLYPLTHLELGDQFKLDDVLQWGSLPEIYALTDTADRQRFLKAYNTTYLREEILIEQLIRQIRPFRLFLPVAAQMNGEIINYAHIANDLRIDDKTVQSYYEILEDTLLGFRLPAYHTSIRKRQRVNPKFYLFDIGVTRSLQNSLSIALTPGSFEYGKVFEHFVILEIKRLIDYFELDYQLYYLRTKDDVEIDLIIERPGLPLAFIEIKSTTRIEEHHIRQLNRFAIDYEKCEAFCLSNDKTPKKIGSVRCLPWQQGFKALGVN